MSFLFFFCSVPCLSRHGFFPFSFIKTLHFFYKKLSGRGTNRHVIVQCGPRKKMHMATLWHPFPQVSPCRERSATTGLDFSPFFCLFFFIFLLNSTAGLRLLPPLPRNHGGEETGRRGKRFPQISLKSIAYRYIYTQARKHPHTYT